MDDSRQMLRTHPTDSSILITPQDKMLMHRYRALSEMCYGMNFKIILGESVAAVLAVEQKTGGESRACD